MRQPAARYRHRYGVGAAQQPFDDLDDMKAVAAGCGHPLDCIHIVPCEGAGADGESDAGLFAGGKAMVSLAAPRSDTTTPSEPHSPWITRIKSQSFCEQNTPLMRL
jgi:hypothetical protein